MRARTTRLLAAASLAAGLALPRGVQAGPVDNTHVELGDIAFGSSSEGFQFNGLNAGDDTGISVSIVGDVNGDGMADLAVGAFRYNDGITSPPTSNISARGITYVVFGKADSETMDAIDLFSPNSGEGFAVLGINGYSGYNVSGAGDVNGDGLDDIIIGAPIGATYGGNYYGAPLRGTYYLYNKRGSGEAFVVFGKADSAPIALLDLQDDGDARGFAIGRPYGTSQEFIAYDVEGAGDVNGDGLADVIIGMPRFGDSSSPARGYYSPFPGAAAVVFGKADGNFVDVSAVVAGSGGFGIQGAFINDQFGKSVSGAGDVNGDGLADVIVGSPLYYGRGRGIGNANDAAYVVFGKEDTSPVLAVDLQDSAQSGGFMIADFSYQSSYALAGRSVGWAGDVNGDGLSDVIIGAPNYYNTQSDRGSGPFAQADDGAAYVVFGKPDGNPVDLGTVADNYSASGFIIRGFSTYDFDGYGGYTPTQSGWEVNSAGDFDGDGFFDLIVGAPIANYLYYGKGVYVRPRVGKSFVVFGKTTGEEEFLHSIDSGYSSGVAIAGAEPVDYSGFSVSGALIGDMDGDGFSDVAIGAPSNPYRGYYYNPGGRGRGLQPDAGEGYVVFSKTSPRQSLTGTYQLHTRPGDGPGGAIVPATEFGDVARVRLDFSDDDFATSSALTRGNLGGPSTEFVSIRRSKDLIQNLAPLGQENEIADVMWEIHTDRVNWDSVYLTLKYLDSEVASISVHESNVAIYRAADPAGPWEQLPTTSLFERNRVRTQLSGPDDTSLGFFAIAIPFAPLYVDLTSFAANSDGAGSPVVVSWETSLEVNSLGFHVYAADPDGSGGWTKGERLTDSLVVAQGGPTTGASYAFVDPDELDSDSEARAYFLEDIDTGGRATLHGPAVLAIRGIPAGVTDWKRFE